MQAPGDLVGQAKAPFDIDRALRRINAAIRPYPKATLFQLYDEGYTTPFEILVACVLSIRTRDEVSLVAAKALFARARTPREVDELDAEELVRLIAGTTFGHQKVATLKRIARKLVTELGGALPCDEAVLLGLPGVGPKCAGLVLGIACGQPFIGVDIHVHRVTNRWGYVAAATPEKTLQALRARLPRKYWVQINASLVPFGKHICTGVRPLCSRCPVVEMCRQVGVREHR
jgi:endonuclease-3